jgi:hypothetical protein
MEVHAPEHGIHTWRDFFVHMGTICLGLIIALGLEQIAEAIHHSHQRTELREALNADSRQAMVDAKRSEQYSETMIAWFVNRAGQVRTALATNTPLAARPAVRAVGYDLIGNSAFNAAKASGLLALLSQREVQAYSEEDGLVTLVLQSFDSADKSRDALRVFELQFRAGDGSFDFSKATPEELHHYRELLLSAAVATNLFRLWNQQDRGLETALLRGERDMPTLQKAERMFNIPIAALKA